jgi:Ras-related protein Rab-1A
VGGHQRFLPFTLQLYPETDGIILVYDATNLESFKELVFWKSEVSRALPEAVILMVGNKQDLAASIRVSKADCTAQAEAWGINAVLVSAKIGGNEVDEVFQKMLALLCRLE